MRDTRSKAQITKENGLQLKQIFERNVLDVEWIDPYEKSPSSQCIILVRIEGFMKFDPANKDTPILGLDGVQFDVKGWKPLSGINYSEDGKGIFNRSPEFNMDSGNESVPSENASS